MFGYAAYRPARAGVACHDARVRLALLSLAVSTACAGSRGPAEHPAAAAPVFPEYAATRWIPAKPSYVLAAKSFTAAQHGLRDFLDSFGMFVGVDARGASTALEGVIGIDPLSPDPMAGLGIDLRGGFAAFSEDVNPTFVVHLTAPEQTQAFFDHQRQRGMVTQSVMVEGAEVFTTQIGGGVSVSWAVADGWMWVHFAFPGIRDDAQWFVDSRHAGGEASWGDTFRWAQNAGGKTARTSNVVGYANLHDLIAGSVAHSRLGACMRLVEPIGRIAVSMDGEDRHAQGRLALELAPGATDAMARHVMPIPAGFAAVAADAAFAAQWNLDLDAIVAWLAPCAAPDQIGLDKVLEFGVRSARVIVKTFDLDDKSGTGVVAFDLARPAFFAKQLDEIPFRSHLESNRRFGALDGHNLSVPWGPKIDYILTDHLAMAGVGNGLLERVVTGGVQPGPVLALDIAPPALKPRAWEWLYDKLGVPNARWATDQLLHWHDGHIVVRIDGNQLILDAFGDRR
jgi:hypothetical protein